MFQILLWSPWKYRCGQRTVRMAVMACSQKQGSLRAQAQLMRTETVETVELVKRIRNKNKVGYPPIAAGHERLRALGGINSMTERFFLAGPILVQVGEIN
ncbi:hypothetical protein TNCV_3159171 [Trichonephila clavipes]|nr:hypothetical protein TNCV_3159171 [Trichonephila clavipes]